MRSRTTVEFKSFYENGLWKPLPSSPLFHIHTHIFIRMKSFGLGEERIGFHIFSVRFEEQSLVVIHDDGGTRQLPRKDERRTLFGGNKNLL